jgi:ADP-ribose pyrophosphatase YjhB (NUDIX family)
MTLVRDTFCSFCGTAYTPPLAYPRVCAHCKMQVWANPIPVSMVIVPVKDGARTGALVVRRGMNPGKGMLALVGGFLEDHETWAEGGAREVREETGVLIDPASCEELWFTSTSPNPNRLLLFSVSAPVELASLPPLPPNEETAERGVIFGPDGLEPVFAFSLHVEAARRFFAQRGIRGPHEFRPV